MPQAPIPLFLVLAALMTAAAFAAIYVRTRWFGFRPNKWTWLGWALFAAVVAYFLVQGFRHP